MTDKYQFMLHVTGPDFERAFDLAVGGFTIGRESGNDLVLANPLISRHHARIVCSESECTITDLGSSNGTIINDEKATPQVPYSLDAGTVVKVGPYNIEIEVIQVAEPEPIPPVEPQQDEAEQKQEPAEIPEPVPVQTEPLKSDLESVKEGGEGISEPPPPEVPATPPAAQPAPEKKEQVPPPGLAFTSIKLIDYLPGMYQNEFTSHFLALFESILFPIEWNVDNFDIFLDPNTTPSEFMPWLMNWFQISVDSTWSDTQRRKLLENAHQIFARRGTRWALARTLEIYIGDPPEIIDDTEDLPPYTFKVKLPVNRRRVNQELVEQLINANKPAYTTYSLEYAK